MWEFTADIEIDRDPESVWQYLIDIDAWWLASNPDHERLEILSDEARLHEGMRVLIEESIAGIHGRGEGSITALIEGERVSWESRDFRYALFGSTLRVREGVEWRLSRLKGGGTVLSAYVWARFPATLVGRVGEFVAKRLLNGLQRDYDHALAELRYVKSELEAAQSAVLDGSSGRAT